MFVISGQLVSVNDVSSCKTTPFMCLCSEKQPNTDQKVLLSDVNGDTFNEQGLWVSVDGDYLKTLELLVGDSNNLDLPI